MFGTVLFCFTESCDDMKEKKEEDEGKKEEEGGNGGVGWLLCPHLEAVHILGVDALEHAPPVQLGQEAVAGRGPGGAGEHRAKGGAGAAPKGGGVVEEARKGPAPSPRRPRPCRSPGWAGAVHTRLAPVVGNAWMCGGERMVTAERSGRRSRKAREREKGPCWGCNGCDKAGPAEGSLTGRGGDASATENDHALPLLLLLLLLPLLLLPLLLARQYPSRASSGLATADDAGGGGGGRAPPEDRAAAAPAKPGRDAREGPVAAQYAGPRRLGEPLVRPAPGEVPGEGNYGWGKGREVDETEGEKE